jgi:rhamnosyltransferase subunit B
MTVLLLTIGSAGDVLPFIGIGQALRARGHRVQVIVNPHFGDLVQRAGLEFIPLGTAADFDALKANPDLWHRRRAFPLVMKSIGQSLDQVYRAVMDHYVPGDTVIAASSLALGARVAQDQFDLPLATVHLAPAVFASAYAPPRLPGVWMPGWLPVWARRAMFDVGHRTVVDRMIRPVLNEFRAGHGLPPVHHVLKDWWNSPRRVIGLWPDWYAPPQPDWPANTVLCGFPLYDAADTTPMPAELCRFLDQGEKPIVFTPGTAMHHAQQFFAAAADACQQLGRRGILLTRHRAHLPPALPPTVLHVEYAPLSRLLPRAAAIVHHGGIGTSAQAMASGVPQVVCPFSFDQVDNARRLEELGVAYTSRNLGSSLNAVLSNKSIHEKLARVAQRLSARVAVMEAARTLESLFDSDIYFD